MAAHLNDKGGVIFVCLFGFMFKFGLWSLHDDITNTPKYDCSASECMLTFKNQPCDPYGREKFEITQWKNISLELNRNRSCVCVSVIESERAYI